MKPHSGFFDITLNLCLNAGRISGGVSADWLTGECTNAVWINKSINRLPSWRDS